MIAHSLLRRVLTLAGAFLLLLCGGATRAEEIDYLENKALSGKLKEITRKHRDIARLKAATVTEGRNDVWLLELGSGDQEARRQRPALLVVAGVEGTDLAGTASVVRWAEALVSNYSKDEQVKALLDSTTVFVWPRLNPDATTHYFGNPRLESPLDRKPVDEDRDGMMDEDGPEDLNDDGLITWMRVQDPEGEYILDPVDPRLMLKADKFKGERGAWRLIPEGRDDDGDEQWNEDGAGGVNLNRNFPYNYRFFSPGAGVHPVSEIATRALADFVIATPQISAVFSFGSTDNLSETPKAEAPKRPPTALHEGDLGWYRELGKRWRELLGVKKEMPGGSEPGTFSDWMYYHRGRLSLVARAWSPALQLELAKASKGDAKPAEKNGAEEVKKAEGAESKETESKREDKGPAKKEEDKRNEEDRAFLKWIDEHSPEGFVAWTEVEHPDFPGRKVEVGGFAPYARILPANRLPESLAEKHARFLTELAGKLPRVAIHSAEAKSLGNDVYEITAKITNTGELPTALAQGETSREVHPTRAILSSRENSILSGKRTVTVGALDPGQIREVRWVVHEPGEPRFDIEVISMIAGRTSATAEVKKETK